MEHLVEFKVAIENRSDRRTEMMLEPEGSDFWMEPGDTFVVHSKEPPTAEFPFTVQVTNDGISVWAAHGWVSTPGGEDLDTGHNKPDDAHPELKRYADDDRAREDFFRRLFSRRRNAHERGN
ncbi:hypothetical protein ACFXPX_20680 [Kitasatospora sp. NPDC059146]|uniref:hypothetical protein n=1 Tax=Kitasatospora sp. NPDC059146 TaxID=3346741 RepID=UPI0036CD087F